MDNPSGEVIDVLRGYRGNPVIAAGTTPDGSAYAPIIVEPDGTARLSDETMERIARRVAELLR